LPYRRSLRRPLSSFKNTTGTIHTGTRTITDIGITIEGTGYTGTASIFLSLSIKLGGDHLECRVSWPLESLHLARFSRARRTILGNSQRAAWLTRYLFSEVIDLKPTTGLYPGSGVLEYWSAQPPKNPDEYEYDSRND
jgi:hypothetical protein